jgi:hypothetical protein
MRYVVLSVAMCFGVAFIGCGGDDEGTGGNATEEVCGDSIDNDADGQIDCADSECANLFECKNPPVDAGPAVDSGPAAADSGTTPSADAGSPSSVPDAGTASSGDGGSTPQGDEICDDTIDNDGDLMVDCADEDCFGVGDCPRGPEDCSDGQDNNGDNLVDCQDPLCEGDQSCGGGGPEGMPCMDVVMCLQSCPDEQCQAECLTNGTDRARGLAQAVIRCDNENGCTSAPECLQEHCEEEVTACQGDMP